MQATRWYAQLNDGTKMVGGQPYDNNFNVSAVPMDQLKMFTVAHNTFSHTYYVPTKQWYKDGVRWNDYSYPTLYQMPDGTTLTVDVFNTNLKLTQV